MCDGLMQRTMTFLEANIDFTVIMDNIFTASAKVLPLPVDGAGTGSIVNGAHLMSEPNDDSMTDMTKSVAFRRNMTKQMQLKVTKQLMTLCSCLYERPLVFAQSQSAISM